MCAIKIPVSTPVQPAEAREHRAEKDDVNDDSNNSSGGKASGVNGQSVVTQVEKGSDCGGSSVLVQTVDSLNGEKSSFQALTVIDPESTSDFTVNAASPEAQQDVSTEMRGLSVEEKGTAGTHAGELEGTGSAECGESLASSGRGGTSNKWVSAVFVFGGMDTLGNIHGDAFILVP